MWRPLAERIVPLASVAGWTRTNGSSGVRELERKHHALLNSLTLLTTASGEKEQTNSAGVRDAPPRAKASRYAKAGQADFSARLSPPMILCEIECPVIFRMAVIMMAVMAAPDIVDRQRGNWQALAA